MHFDKLRDQDRKQVIAELTAGYDDRTEYFVDRLARGLGRIAAGFHPYPVIVRMRDFKTNEYANLIGGAELSRRRKIQCSDSGVRDATTRRAIAIDLRLSVARSSVCGQAWGLGTSLS